jgi:site-specific DNA recombinase
MLAQRYDDGGYTGANLDRPALRKLLADIEAGRLNSARRRRFDRNPRKNHTKKATGQ